MLFVLQGILVISCGRDVGSGIHRKLDSGILADCESPLPSRPPASWRPVSESDLHCLSSVHVRFPRGRVLIRRMRSLIPASQSTLSLRKSHHSSWQSVCWYLQLAWIASCESSISGQPAEHELTAGLFQFKRAFLSIAGAEGILIGLWFGDHGNVGPSVTSAYVTTAHYDVFPRLCASTVRGIGNEHDVQSGEG
jgi:hypothetical protein